LKEESTGLARVVAAFGHSCDGLRSAWETEASFRQLAIAAFVLVPVACLLPLPIMHRALLVASVLMVMVVELINTSLEAAIDRISLERHPLSKRAKDAGSAAVLLAIAVAVVIWGGVLGPWLGSFA
jgi:diacylglycerol kinase (ATP)